MKIESILVPTDFSETANHAVEQALELAIRSRAKLHLFHVVEPKVESWSGGVAGSLRDYLQGLERDAEQSLALKVEVLRGNEVDVRYSTASELTPFEGISRKVEEIRPELVVMGTHGRTGLDRLVMGSVAERVLRHVSVNVLTLNAKCPVVRAARAFERILVPVDFSEFSKRALLAAQALRAEGGHIRVAHVVASPIHPSFYAGGINRLFQIDPEMPQRIRTNLESWLGKARAEIEVREGDVFAELMDVAEEDGAQLIVMGTRGLTGLDHLLMGSVTEKVVRRSEIPVLTVH